MKVAATSRWLKDLVLGPSGSSSRYSECESTSHSDCMKSNSELESSQSERLSSHSSHSLNVSEMRNALDESSRVFNLGASDSGEFTFRGAWWMAVKLLTFITPAKGRRETTSALTLSWPYWCSIFKLNSEKRRIPRSTRIVGGRSLRRRLRKAAWSVSRRNSFPSRIILKCFTARTIA